MFWFECFNCLSFSLVLFLFVSLLGGVVCCCTFFFLPFVRSVPSATQAYRKGVSLLHYNYNKSINHYFHLYTNITMSSLPYNTDLIPPLSFLSMHEKWSSDGCIIFSMWLWCELIYNLSFLSFSPFPKLITFVSLNLCPCWICIHRIK